jgi:hypothetical protein
VCVFGGGGGGAGQSGTYRPTPTVLPQLAFIKAALTSVYAQ